MTLDWWGLGLQAINVLILVWLLSRIFWRPVADAIARRQAAAQELLDAGQSAQAKADAALAEVSATRAGIAAERDAILSEAQATAASASKAAMVEARAQADALLSAARTAIARDAATAHRENAAAATALAVEIAAKLLGRFNTDAVQVAFREKLVAALADMSAAERATLLASAGDIEIVTATEPTPAEQTAIKAAVTDALGGTPDLRFATEPGLIAGLELRSAHFELRNSWQADLETILKEIENAG